MASQADISSRQINTTTQGYDQIVALSQNNINASFAFLFENNDAFRTIDIDVPDEGTMNADMNPPTVEFVVNSELHKVYFFLNFDTGTFEYWTGHGPSSKKHDISMKDWVFAFAVNLDLSLLDAQRVPEDVQKRIKVPGSYSVSQLLLDFQTADLDAFSIDKSSMPGLDLTPGRDVDQKAYLTLYLNKYVEQLKGGEHNILGYAVTVPDPAVANPYAPTFPPTDLQFQTYAYRSGGDASAPPQPGYNMLLFLEMTEHRPFPPAALNWSGNWLIPNMAGTMAISKQNFWNRYLLPKLVDINHKTIVHISSVRVSGLNTTWSWNKYDEGLKDYSWKDTTNGATFHYESSQSDSENDGLAKFNGDANSSVDNKIQWTAGSPTINVSGRTYMHAGLDQHILGIPEEAWVMSAVDWHFDMTLNSVHDGSLEVKVTDPVVTPSRDDGGDLLGKLENSIGGNISSIASDIESNILRGLQTDTWKSQIENALNGQQHFVFPGGGTFDMKNPMFNNEGDLIVELTYKQE
ncbi:hypothetical protein K440DRAFT_657304 [Wilcoxina mikolae CBS 423.85]|nr:hypothetical protein K440DRAFT_657304 [Wilcoxina mikolae CBS 423.85]